MIDEYLQHVYENAAVDGIKWTPNVYDILTQYTEQELGN